MKDSEKSVCDSTVGRFFFREHALRKQIINPFFVLNYASLETENVLGEVLLLIDPVHNKI